MPIGLVSDSDLQAELNRLNPSSQKVVPSAPLPKVEIMERPVRPTASPDITVMERPGRDKGDNNVPESLRKIIGEDALLNGRSSAVKLALDFGISPSSVSAYAKGATSTASINEPKSGLVQHLNKARQRAIRKASKTLNGALSAITQEKLDYADATDLSGIAKDMSVIIKNLEPQKESTEGGAATPQFTIYAPQFRDERTFEVINVNE